jgi:tyrosyl-tRNA synthetase
MLAKDVVASRLETDQGISYTEFSYQVLQSLDFAHMFNHHNCTLQFGGNDQWGNLTAGVDFIKKTTGKAAFCFTTPLITKADGSKFGKSDGGNIWLDPELTSPYKFYQFWINVEDQMCGDYLKVFTFLSLDEIADIIRQSAKKPDLRIAQKALAYQVTSIVHGREATERIIAATKAIFGSQDLHELDAQTLAEIADEVGKLSLSDKSTNALSLLVLSGIAKSKNEARQIIASGGAYINNKKVPSNDYVESQLLFDKYLLLRRGKKTLKIVEFE